MLEQTELRLLPWTLGPAGTAAPAPVWRRVVQCTLGVPLGCVRWLHGPSWLGCGPRRLDVCETEDAALLMTVEHGWFGFGNWRVFDAERSRVGGVVGAYLLDEQGMRFATIWHDGAAARTIRKNSGAVCARIEAPQGDMTVMRFADDVPMNPFTRMVLLGACIVQQPAPPRQVGG
ncbi:MAG: hypothetical protein L0Y71_20815 [Gemmataceae bacterium]|nr:hypothetical protein [Gemmataceae bacterium]